MTNPYGKLPHAGLCVDLQSEAVSQVAHGRLGTRSIDNSPPGGLGSVDDVLHHRQ